tara:strand:+ start:645 stop:818 length:174 start_codon:yes stop_codon:yes gene_type:complete
MYIDVLIKKVDTWGHRYPEVINIFYARIRRKLETGWKGKNVRTTILRSANINLAHLP